MNGCHQCPHAIAIAGGKYTNTPWEEIPCATCDVERGGGFVIEFDDSRPGESKQVVLEKLPSAKLETLSEDLLPMDVMRDAMAAFLELPPVLRDVVAWRHCGMSYQEIADVHNVTMAGAEARHRRAMRLWPILKELFPEKIAKQARRRVHRRSRKRGQGKPHRKPARRRRRRTYGQTG